MAQVEAEWLLQCHCNWATEQGSWVSAKGPWLYGLAARIAKPPSSATSSQLSKLMKDCRGVLVDNSDQTDTQLPAVSVIMAIAGAYFRQDECMVGLCSDELD